MIYLRPEEYEWLVAHRYEAMMEKARLCGFIEGCADIVDENPDFFKRYLKERVSGISQQREVEERKLKSLPEGKLSELLEQERQNAEKKALFEQVVKELDVGIRKEGLWVKALMCTDGDHNKAYLEYVALRAQAIKDEA